MKLLKKDIKKDFFKDGTRQGELKPIIYKDGMFLVPTSRGYREIRKKKR